jgi:RNA-directed DNA polymerase
MINPKLPGWIYYYGRFTPSPLRPIERYVGRSMVRWACRKYKKLRNHRSRAWQWLMRYGSSARAVSAVATNAP